MYTSYVACFSVKVQPDGIESLITLSEGDMRRALNILQVWYTPLDNAPLYVFSTTLCMCAEYSVGIR